MTSPRQKKKKLAILKLKNKTNDSVKQESKTITEPENKQVQIDNEAIIKNTVKLTSLKAKKSESKNGLVEMPDKKINTTGESTDQTVKSES